MHVPMLGRSTAVAGFTLGLLVLVLAGTAAASERLRADAGSSQQALGLDTTLPVEGEAFGGQAPYSYTWSIDGDQARFASPTNASTSVDLSGLAGTVNLTFTVEDAAGEQASDHVLYHVAEPVAEPVETDVTLGPGVPDEIVGASGLVDRQTKDVSFEVPAGAELIVAQLTWQDDDPAMPLTGNDLDLVLLDPRGEEATGFQGRTPDHPETVRTSDPRPGTWTARIEAWLTTREDAHLEIHVVDAAELPSAVTRGPTTFGVEDQVTLHGAPRVANATAAWDLDHDGAFEATGNTTTMDVGPGTYPVRYKATTPDGFESIAETLVEVTDRAEHALGFRCKDSPLWQRNMEHSWSGGKCWMHGGHHTYVFEEPVRLVGGAGSAFSVEQQFSPPSEYEEVPFETPLHLEVSQRGDEWTHLEDANYRFLEDPREGSIGLMTRQRVTYTFDADAEPVRMFRIHQPPSAAQGLSGFLDASRGHLLVNTTDEGASPPTLGPGTVELTCREDVLEAFFAEHPCWFGGVNRYDAASFFHTYHPGDGTTVSEVEVTAQVAPWRTDDWFLPISISGDQVEQTTQTRVFVQASPDGRSWTTLGEETVAFGEPATFEITLDEAHPASFVRLVTDHHPLYDQYRQSPSLHHPEAYLVHSEVALTGQVPTGGS